MPYKDPEQAKERSRRYYQSHKEKIKEYDKQYYQNNEEQLKEYKKQWYQDNKERIKKHKQDNKEKRREHQKNRLKNDIDYKILKNLRNRLYFALKNNSKAISTKELLGCTIDKLKIWLEIVFQPGMNWKNYGEWHIDHIKPCASFDMSDPEQQRECFHYTNLQPLWAEENLKKGARICV